MAPRADLADVEEPVEIAATWGDLFFSGQVRELDWLTTRTCTVDLAGSASDAEPLGHRGLCEYSQALHRAFEEVAWRVGRIEQREHEVRLDASLEALHTGPLDLSLRGGGTFEATGRLLRLPLQRLCWTIAHKRVLGFEVERGPGLGMDLIARELELADPVADAQKQPTRSNRSSNGHAPAGRENGSTTARTPPSRGDEDARPSIEELIQRAKVRVEDP